MLVSGRLVSFFGWSLTHDDVLPNGNSHGPGGRLGDVELQTSENESISPRKTVDGWNPVNSPVEVGSLSHSLQGFIHPRWLFGTSSINSRNNEKIRKSSLKNLPPQAKPCHGFVLGSSSIQIQSKVPNTRSERNSNTANLLETHTRAGFLVSGGECWNTIYFFGMTLRTLPHCFTVLRLFTSKGRESSNLRFRSTYRYIPLQK